MFSAAAATGSVSSECVMFVTVGDDAVTCDVSEVMDLLRTRSEF